MGQRCVTERRGFWYFLFEDSPAEFIYAFCVVAVYLTRCFISRYFL